LQRRRFQFCIERLQGVRRLFLQLLPLSTLSSFGSQSARRAARPYTTSCGLEASETIPFSGADSILSIRCGAISGRLGRAVRSSRAAIPSNRKAWAQKINDQPRRSPPGRGVRAVEGGHGVGSGDPRYVAGQSEERTTLALFQKEISLRIFARLPRGRIREHSRSVN
jgi:hypothetical protein